jgi:hypothetical protein
MLVSTTKHILGLYNSMISNEFSNSSKSIPVVTDILLSNATTALPDEVANFRSTILKNLMEYYSSNYRLKQMEKNSRLCSNIVQLTSYIVDLHQAETLPWSMYEQSIQFIVDVCLQTLEMEKNQKTSTLKGTMTTILNIGGSTLTRSDSTTVLRSLNRMILLILQHEKDSLDRLAEALAAMIEKNWFLTTLSPANKDSEYFASICYLFYTYIMSDSTRLRDSVLLCWKLMAAAQNNLFSSVLTFRIENDPNNATVDLSQGFVNLLEKDYTQFMVWFSEQQETISHYFDTYLAKTFNTHIENESKNAKNLIGQFMMGNMSIPSNRGRSNSGAMLKKVKKTTDTHHNLARDCVVDLQKTKERGEKRIQLRREQDILRITYAVDKWKIMRDLLFEECAVWHRSDDFEQKLWRLDYTEGPFRMRKKMIPVEKDEQLLLKSKPHLLLQKKTEVVEEEIEKQPDQFIIEQFKKLEQLQQSPVGHSRTFSNEIENESFSEQEEFTDENKTPHTPVDEPSTETSDVTDDYDDYDYEEGLDEDFKIRKLLEPGDVVTEMTNCLRITGLDGQRGLFVFCKDNLYVIDNFNITKDDKLVQLGGEKKTEEENATSPQFPTSQFGDKTSTTVIRLPLSELRDIHKRRFLLQLTAIEFFCVDGRNCLIVFEKNEMPKIYDKVLSRATQVINENSSISDFNSITGYRINQVPNLKQVTTAWQKGEMSNFEYLMHLNTLAGRSFNDLTQYPVFPWILKDYTSDQLNFDDPNIYRDLSKPMGALTESRQQLFKERFDSWCDPNVPKFHYGTHYSSAGTVLYYLLRLEPFTSHSMELQGGKFDHADRMFFSLHDTWVSAATEYTMSDVKELIPEFFYLPEFLINTNQVNFGNKQGGTSVNDLILPSWANNDPYEFIRLHRMALESVYVSEHLHEWIDLIFGHKQTGPEAEKAMNVYYYLTYEGAIDIDKIYIVLDKHVAVDYINNFGQTPHQLFTKPHPRRHLELDNKGQMIGNVNTAVNNATHTLNTFAGDLRADLVGTLLKKPLSNFVSVVGGIDDGESQ